MSDYAVRELPLFPLPDVVLFPQQLLPLHIFESRYRMLLQSVQTQLHPFHLFIYTNLQRQMQILILY